MWQMNNLGIDFHSMGIFSQHFFQSIVVVIICDNRNALQDTDTGMIAIILIIALIARDKSLL